MIEISDKQMRDEAASYLKAATTFPIELTAIDLQMSENLFTVRKVKKVGVNRVVRRMVQFKQMRNTYYDPQFPVLLWEAGGGYVNTEFW